MLPFGLVVAALAAPAAALAFPPHSTPRTVLAITVFFWTPLVLVAAWMAKVNYALHTRVDGTSLQLLTIGARRTIDVTSLDRIRSFSLWGSYAGTHTLRLHTRDGRHALVIADMTLASLNRKNFAREGHVREALRHYAELADPRARWWLGAGPRPPRLASARHVVAMMLLFGLSCIGLLVALVAYITVALY
jgi:hypothetical protein